MLHNINAYNYFLSAMQVPFSIRFISDHYEGAGAAAEIGERVAERLSQAVEVDAFDACLSGADAKVGARHLPSSSGASSCNEYARVHGTGTMPIAFAKT